MLEPIATTVIRSFVVGLFVGIIYRINKKLIAVIWGLTVLALLFSLIFGGGFTGFAEGLNWGIWNWIVMIIFVFIGHLSGESGVMMIKEAFKK